MQQHWKRYRYFALVRLYYESLGKSTKKLIGLTDRNYKPIQVNVGLCKLRKGGNFKGKLMRICSLP